MKRPNLVLIVLDTVRADRLSCYGYRRETTPFLDLLAKEGVLFEQAITPATWTLPSHVSIFTGLFPSKHGAHRAHQRFDAPYVTLAELLTQYGYHSAAFSNIDWVSPVSGVIRGFNEFYGRAFGQSKERKEGESDSVVDKGGRRIVGEVKRWIRRRKEDPFFLFLNLFEAHNPYDPPDPYSDFYIPVEDKIKIPRINRDITKYYVGQEAMDETDFEILGNLYDGAVHYLDKLVEDLVEFMRNEDVLDKSLLVITSDHGENIGDHGHWGHRYCLYETLIHVPLILRYPGIFDGGKRVGQYVQTVDIYPTMMDLIGINCKDVRKELQGESLFPRSLLPRKRMFTISELVPKPDLHSYDGYPWFDASVFAHGLTAVRYNGYKLIWSTKGQHEFYHLDQDPEESNNIFHKESAKATELRLLLEEWDKSSGIVRQPFSYSIQEDINVNEEVKAQLKALGYIE